MVSDFFISARSLGAVQGIFRALWANKITPRSSLKMAVAMLSSVETMFRIMATDDIDAIPSYKDSLHRGIVCNRRLRRGG